MSKTNLIWYVCVLCTSGQWLLTLRCLLEYSIYKIMEDHLTNNFRLQVLKSAQKIIDGEFSRFYSFHFVQLYSRL